jgi:hypothetical protein
MSVHTDAQSMTKVWLMAVKPFDEAIRRRIGPSVTAMSISACPSIRPRTFRSACFLACSIERRDTIVRSTTTITRIMIGPPMNSAAANCQPSSTASRIPSSSTRFVDASWNAIDAVKSAPFLKIERARATAA